MTTKQTHKELLRQARSGADSDLPRVVIIGGGFGGLQAALHLGKAPVQVTVVDRNNHHLFQPLLYQVATATLSPGEISAPIRHVLRKQQNTSVALAEVTGVDTREQRVLMHDQWIPYDYLVIATGARESYFGHDEWRALAPGLKSIEDARAIRQKILLAFEAAELERDLERVKELLTFVIVGAGPTGVELAGDIAQVAHKALKAEFRHIDPTMTRILLVEAAPRILGPFPEDLARSAHKELERLGVEVHTGMAVTQIDERGVMLGDQRINAHTVLWTAGVQASPAATWLGAEADRAGRVKVTADLSVPGLPNVYVIGDTALTLQHGKPLPGVAPVAMQQGRYVARQITQRVTQGEQTTSPQPFHYRDKGSLAMIGRAFAIIKLGKLHLAGFVAWLLWLSIHIFYLIGFGNRVMVMLQWAWAYLIFQRRVRLITISNSGSSHAPVQGADAPPAPALAPAEDKIEEKTETIDQHQPVSQ